MRARAPFLPLATAVDRAASDTREATRALHEVQIEMARGSLGNKMGQQAIAAMVAIARGALERALKRLDGVGPKDPGLAPPGAA